MRSKDNNEIENRLRISYVNKTMNEEVLERAGKTRTSINEIRKRQATFFEHIKRLSI